MLLAAPALPKLAPRRSSSARTGESVCIGVGESRRLSLPDTQTNFALASPGSRSLVGADCGDGEVPQESEAAVEGVYETLADRVDVLIEAHKNPLLTTSGTHGAITEILERIEGLEDALREIALEVQEIADAKKLA